MTFRHRKKRNIGLIYEFLVRRMANQMIDGDKKGFNESVTLTKKYFSEGKILTDELNLFNIIKNARGTSSVVARRILGEVRKSIKTLDHKKIEASKDSLIKEINHRMGKDFYSKYRLPEYRLLASIQIMIDGCKGSRHINENVQVIELEESLISYMTSSGNYVEGKKREDIDGLVCAIASKKFGQKYGRSLNESQKLLLGRYMIAEMNGDRESFSSFLKEEKNKISVILESRRNDSEIQKDSIMRERFIEAVDKLNSLPLDKPSEEILEEMLLFRKLVEELEHV